jgi:hypothetical protein
VSNFEIEIASIPTRDKLVAEIFYKHEQWVEISQETDELIVRFYSPDEGNCWKFNLDEALEVLQKAKLKLLGLN